MANDSDNSAFLWVWWHHVFNAWLLLLALLAFLPAGIVIGYQVSLPSRYSEVARAMLDRLDDLETLLVKVQNGRPPDVVAEDRKLVVAILDAQEAVDKLPFTQHGIANNFADIRSHAEDIAKALNDQSRNFDHQVSEDLKEIRKQRDVIDKQVDAATGFWRVVYDQTKRFLKWIGAISFLTLMIIVLFIFALNNPRIRRVVAKSGSVSAFGVSFSFADVPSVRASIATRQLAVGEDVVCAYSVALRNSGVEETFGKVYATLREVLKRKNINLAAIDHRVTLYVPDFVGEDLLQATRYYGNWNLKAGETIIGRRFSVRYGIIGRAWRMQSCQYYSNVGNDGKNLIRNWGFTAAETRGFAKPTAGAAPLSSLMAFVLEDVGSQPPLGLVYLEAMGANMLHDKIELCDKSAEADERDTEGLTLADLYARNAVWEEVIRSAEIRKLKRVLIRLQSVLQWNEKVEGGIGR